VIYQPRVYQHLIRDFACNTNGGRVNVFAGMGLGKTASSLDIFETWRVFGEAERAVVFAPKLVSQVTWPDEQQKWRDTFGHLRLAAAVGTADQRLAALRSNPDVLAINYENIFWLLEQYGDEWPYDTVFADECTRLKGLRIALQTSKLGKEFVNGQGSKRAKALAKIAHTKVRRWINLSGSPAPNGIADLWGPMFFVDKGARLGTSFGGFHDRWFKPVRMPDGYTEWKPHAHSQAEIETLIKDVSLSIDARDYFDIAAPIEKIIPVPIPAKHRKTYDEMEREFFTEVRRGDVNVEVEAFNGGSKMNKCRQIGAGFVYLEDKSAVWLHDAKVDALKSVIEDAAGASVLISYQFKPELAAILKAFPRARQLKTAREIKAFQDGSLRIGVAHPASVGHGHSLQDNCWILCDFSSGWNLEEDEQILERIGPTRQAQSGYKRAVYRVRLVAADTVEDNVVLPRTKTKASVQELIKAAMKRRSS
jgi:hypothetical protein